MRKAIRFIFHNGKVVQKQATTLVTSDRFLKITSSVPWLAKKPTEEITVNLSFDPKKEELYLCLTTNSEVFQLQSMNNILEIVPELAPKNKELTEYLDILVEEHHLCLAFYSDTKYSPRLSLCINENKPTETLSFACPEELINSLFTEELDIGYVQETLGKLAQWEEYEFISIIMDFLTADQLSLLRKFMFINMNKVASLPIEARRFLKKKLLGSSRIPTLG